MEYEAWKPIKGYEGLYEVSSLGRVKSLKSRRTGGELLMKLCKKDNGYLYVSLWKNRKGGNRYIHRLVAEAFVENPNRYKVVNHLDFDVSNNKASNLEWTTQRENVNHAKPRMRKPHKPWKDSSCGEKHIYKRYGKYRLNIKGKIDKCYDTLEEAIRMREVVLNGEKYNADRT